MDASAITPAKPTALPRLRQQLLIQTGLHHDYYDGQDFAERVYAKTLQAAAFQVAAHSTAKQQRIAELRRRAGVKSKGSN